MQSGLHRCVRVVDPAARRRPVWRLPRPDDTRPDDAHGIYVCRSTDDEHQPYSIDAQDKQLRDYITSQPGWRMVARFHDDASGATTTRPYLQRALSAARAGLFDVLLVYRVDRFSRSLRDTVALLEELDDAGVVFRSSTEPFDTSGPMGRMLLQLLAMFAQFERDTIIERVIAVMERKATRGKWKGGRRPFGYQVDTTTHTLVPDSDSGEAVIVRTIFDLYTRDRLGSRLIATTLNERGHRTTTGGPWSAHQVVRALSNRAYLGELTFRDHTVTNTHPPLISPQVWAQIAETILAARGDSAAHRAASGSDYHLTGLLRCPQCGKAMLGTRATGRTRTYRYYTCFARARYGTTHCDAPRLNADAVDTAILDALTHFYRTQHTLITDAVTTAQRDHHNAHADRHAELATITAELTKTRNATERYLRAFENGTLDEDLVAERLNALKATTRQLTARRAELAADLQNAPTAPDPATLNDVAEHLAEIITSGTPNQRKALVEALVARVMITRPDRLVPVFRVPQPGHNEGAAPTQPAGTAPNAPVRTPTNLVEVRPVLAHITGHTRRLLEMTDSWVPVVDDAAQHQPSYRPRQQESVAVQLGEAGVYRLISRFLAGERQAELAREYGCSLSTVQRLLRTRGVRRWMVSK
ncbi:MAG: recombinase family protein [Pseudonocardia sp.]